MTTTTYYKPPPAKPIGNGATVQYDKTPPNPYGPPESLQFPNPPIDAQYGSYPYSRPPHITRGGANGSATYLTNEDQYTPLQHYPLYPNTPLGIHAFQAQVNRNLGDYWGQVIPTSINLRNRGLEDLLQSANMNFEGVYAGQNVGQAADSRAQALETARGQAAGRGLVQSGGLDRALRSINADYLSKAAAGQTGAYTQEAQRKAGLIDQINNLVNSDIDFYKYINAGRDVAVGRAQPVSIGALSGITRGASGLIAGLWPDSKTPEVNTSTPNTPNVGFNPSASGVSGANMSGEYSSGPDTGDTTSSWWR